jgi:hypothetical protein
MSHLRDLALNNSPWTIKAQKEPPLCSRHAAASPNCRSRSLSLLSAESSSTHRRAFLLPRNTHTRLHSSRSDEKSSYIFDGTESRKRERGAKTFTEGGPWSAEILIGAASDALSVVSENKKLLLAKKPRFFCACTYCENCFARDIEIHSQNDGESLQPTEFRVPGEFAAPEPPLEFPDLKQA